MSGLRRLDSSAGGAVRPVPGIERPFPGGVAPHVARGQDVQQRDLPYPAYPLTECAVL